MTVWAVVLTLVMFWLAGSALANLAKKDKDGKRRVTARYEASGDGGKMVEWKLRIAGGEWRKTFFLTLASGILTVAGFYFPWFWLKIALFGVVSICGLIWIFAESRDPIFVFKEIGRKKDENGRDAVEYTGTVGGEFLAGRFMWNVGFVCLSVIAGYLEAAFVEGAILPIAAAATGILVLAARFVVARIVHLHFLSIQFDYCPKCRGYMDVRHETGTSRSHVGGGSYTETTEDRSVEFCKRCGYQR